MSTELYDLLFEGVAAGQDPEQVKVKFIELFGIASEKVEKIFNSKKAVLKTRVDELTAEKYIARLAGIGVIVGKRKIESSPTEVELSLVPVAETMQSPETEYDAYATEQDKKPEKDFVDEPSAMHQTVAPLYGEDTRRIHFEFNGKGF